MIVVRRNIYEYERYEKYLPLRFRFTNKKLDDQGVENLLFKGFAVIPHNSGSEVFPGSSANSLWNEFMGICVDSPPTEMQFRYAKVYALKDIHYQHWTVHKNEYYEQMVGDELYEGINNLPLSRS